MGTRKKPVQQKKGTTNNLHEESKPQSGKRSPPPKHGKENGAPRKPKQEKKVQKRPLGFPLLIGLGVVIAAGAIVYVNEDLQSLLGLGAPVGQDTGTDGTSDSSATAPHSDRTETPTEQDRKTADAAGTADKTDTADDTVTKKTDTADGTGEPRKPSDTKESSGDEGGSKEAVPGDKKPKPRRKDYSKHSITSQADYKIRKKLDEADSTLSEGDVGTALKQFDSLVQKHPESPRAVFGKALAMDKLAEQKRSNTVLEEALEVMEQALKLDNVPYDLFTQIGEKLVDRLQFRGWNGKAVEIRKYMVSKHPDNLGFRRQLGVGYLLKGRTDLARQVFKDVLERDPDDGFSLVHLGFIVQTTDRDPVKSIPLLKRGIESGAPGTVDGRFYYHLGDAYVRRGQREEADKVYQLGVEKGLFLSQYQRSLYNVDTLTGRPWWTPKQTTYSKHLKVLENNWKVIRDEGLAQLDMKAGAFRPEDEDLRESGDWKQFTLYFRGKKDDKNCDRAPKTCAIIEQIPDARSCTRGQVKFSVMSPGVHVWPHCGPTNCRLRAHLGLVVPEGPRIRVVSETRGWKEGKVMVFDDSFEHEVWHNGTEWRLVLIVDFWHPELTPSQKRDLPPI